MITIRTLCLIIAAGFLLCLIAIPVLAANNLSTGSLPIGALHMKGGDAKSYNNSIYLTDDNGHIAEKITSGDGGRMEPADQAYETIVYGENKTITNFNYHWTDFSGLISDPPSPLPLPVDIYANSEGSTAQTSIRATPGYEGAAYGAVGHCFMWNMRNVPPNLNYHDLPVTFIINYTYQINATGNNIDTTAGSCLTEIYDMQINQWVDYVGADSPIHQSKHTIVRETHANLTQLGHWFYLEVIASAVNPENADPSEIQSSSGYVTINSVRFEFPPPGKIEGQAFERVPRGGGRFELQGINEADVWLIPEGSSTSLNLGIKTNEIGQFTINNVPIGKYRVDIRWGEPGVTSHTDSQQTEVFSGKSTYVFFPSDYFKQMKASAAKDASTSYDELRQRWEEVDYTMNLLNEGASLMTLPISVTQAIPEWESKSAAYLALKNGHDPLATKIALGELKFELIKSLGLEFYDWKQIPIRAVILIFDYTHENIIKMLKEYSEDPPDMNYQEKVILVVPETVVVPSEYSSNLTGYNLMDPYIDLVNDLNDQIAIDDALLTSFERYQGAFLDNQPEFMIMQLEQVDYYSNFSAHKSEEIVEDIHILKPELMNMENEYGIILEDIKQNLSASGFSPDEVAYLQGIGCDGENIDNFKGYLEFENLSNTINYLNTLENVSSSRAANMHNLSVQARDVIIQLNLPIADFTATPKSGTPPLAVQFNDISYGNPTIWNWSFGDNQWFNTTDIASRNATHTYQNTGNYTVNLTVSNSAGSVTESKIDYINVTSGVLSLPTFINPPTDPDRDGLYEDLNGNARKDFNDVVLMFNQMQWIAANEPVSAFDFNGNGRIDFNDIVKLFGEI
jgi:PKD repeat protein